MPLLVLVAAIVTLLNAAPTTAQAPSLQIVAREPIAVRGNGFRAGERVRLVALGSLRRVSVTTVADVEGRFRVSFPRLGADRCMPLVVAAVGARGSRANAKVMRRPCVPPRLPPPRR